VLDVQTSSLAIENSKGIRLEKMAFMRF